MKRSLGNDGVALPLALVGLVAISLLVTTALVSSSTEAALSVAHQDGAASLYSAESALEGYIGSRAVFTGSLSERLVNANVVTQNAADGSAYQIQTALLSRGAIEPVPGGTTVQRRDVYSLTARPENGRGRSVGALVDVLREATPVNFNINSGLTTTVNTTITGNATVSNGTDEGLACAAGDAEHSITHADGTTLDIDGSANVVGETEKSTENSAGLRSELLDGATLEEIADRADIKFGPRWDEVAFSSGTHPSSTSSDVDYQWGCPKALLEYLGRSFSECGNDWSKVDDFPVVAIDANGTTVDLRNYHGQGTLIVLNGSLHVRGNFAFQGIILSEGSLTVTGTPTIEGAVAALGGTTYIDPEANNAGRSTIRYNRCEIDNAQNGLTNGALNASAQLFDTPTYSWFEIVR